LINTIQSIPGTEFISLYAAYALGIIILLKIILWIKDDSRNYPAPPESEITPFEIAVLRNGSNLKAILHTILFSLWQNRLITIRDDGFAFTSPHMDKNQKQSDMERDILQYLTVPRKPDSIIKDPAVLEKLKILLAPVKENLIQKKLVFSDDMIKIFKKTFYVFLIVLLFPAIIKLFLGISRDKPVFFLVVLIIAATVFISSIYKNSTAYTSSGRKYLQELIKRYKQTIKDGKSAAVLPNGVDPVLIAAIFGAGALLAFPQCSLYAQTFNPGRAGSFGDGVSGGSCTSCSCGSGDGGGGDGGGGCGGCGGGD
jgi:uncharacterized protein (TIGR04222 family)